MALEFRNIHVNLDIFDKHGMIFATLMSVSPIMLVALASVKSLSRDEFLDKR